MMTPPFNICARPRFSLTVPTSAIALPPFSDGLLAVSGGLSAGTGPGAFQTKLRCDAFERLDYDADVLLERYAQQFRAGRDVLAADRARERFVFHLLEHRRHIDLTDGARRPDERDRDHKAGQLVGCEQRLFHAALPRYAAVIGVREDGPAERLRQPAPAQQLDSHERVAGLLRRVLLVIDVVQQADEAPSVLIFAELPGVGAHDGLDRQHMFLQIDRARLSDQERPSLVSRHARPCLPSLDVARRLAIHLQEYQKTRPTLCVPSNN